VHPTRVELTTGYHLRPIRSTDVDIDLPAVMGSRDRLWSIYGDAWGWPPESMTREDDRADLARHEAEADAHLSFNYAVLNDDETELIGCVYIDPPEKPGADAEISWWVVDRFAGTTIEKQLDDLVPSWIDQVWPLRQPRYVGRDISWPDWIALPALKGSSDG
jgi:RimJ/RimL family protein N-acetyltransferase